MLLYLLTSLLVASVPPSVPPATRRMDTTETTDTTESLLTDAELKNLTIFQESYAQMPDRVEAFSSAHMEVVRLPFVAMTNGGDLVYRYQPNVGVNRAVFQIVRNMDRLAGHFPAIATALQHTHLTPKTWQEARRSLLIAEILDQEFVGPHPPAGLASTSVRWRNVVFVRAHRQQIDQLHNGGFESVDLPSGVR